jgi:hypothetical protein
MGVPSGRIAKQPLVVFPPAVAHAPSIVARELFLAFEPLAVASRLLARPDLARLLGPGEDAAGVLPDGSWDVQRLVRKLVRASADRDDRRRPRPVPSDRAACSYCPSCLAEYRAGFGRCSDCDVPLVPYVRQPDVR